MLNDNNPLIGKKIRSVWVTLDRQAIKFVTTTGEEIIAKCDADCCSYTWIETVDLPTLPATVRKVEDIDMPDGPASEFHKDSECLAYYGLKITTDKGDILLDYRNDSNGYYGGSLSWPGESHYGGVYGQNKPDESKWMKAKDL